MSLGLNLYQQTSNLSESEQRVCRLADEECRSAKIGEQFEVPLHANDRQYTTFATGLTRCCSAWGHVCGTFPFFCRN